MKKVVLIILLLAIVSGSFIGGYCVSRYITKKDSMTDTLDKTEDTTEVKEKENLKKSNSLSILQKKISDKLTAYDGEWAVYVEDLSSGDSFEINNKKMVSASLIKLFVMGKIYEGIKIGNTDIKDVENYLELMITVSDNEATNALVAHLGGGKYTDMYDNTFKAGLLAVNNYAGGNEWNDTEQQRDLKNSRPVPVPEENYTSVSDCGRLLSRIYHKKLVSESADSQMLEMLKRQTRRAKIPAGLPEGTVCANKTGELGNVENDVAIVFSPATDYVICVMSNSVPNTAKARANIADISQTVYRFFN